MQLQSAIENYGKGCISPAWKLYVFQFQLLPLDVAPGVSAPDVTSRVSPSDVTNTEQVSTLDATSRDISHCPSKVRKRQPSSIVHL